MNKKDHILVIFLIFIFTSFSYSSNKEADVLLENILKKSAEYCEKLQNSALFFTCHEKIREKIFHYSGTKWGGDPDALLIKEINEYLYDYQLIKKGTHTEERRILLEKNDEKTHIADVHLETKRFISEKAVFGPVGLLSSFWQKRYDYQILRKERLSGTPSVVIRAEPKEDSSKDLNYGEIWIAVEDFSILKIKIEPRSLKNYDYFLKEAIKLRSNPDLFIVSYYDVEENKIRFPSKIIFEENYIRLSNQRKFQLSETEFTYTDYRFFTVETEVEIKR